MEAQPPPQSTPPPQSSVHPSPPPPHFNYPDSVDSSPRSRLTDSWDEPYPPPQSTTTKLRLMVSYGGHIAPRPHDKTLSYLGGDTRIVVVDRHTSLSELSTRLSKTFLNGGPFALKYQLPSEDLDSLISVTTDEDLDNMIDEYDRTANANNSSSSSKPLRIRLFLFPDKPDSVQPIGPDALGLGSGKSDDWFLNALNGSAGMSDGGLSDSASVNCLPGVDDDVVAGNNNPNHGSGPGVSAAAQGGSVKNSKQQGQDVHSVSDSPMMETNSSFGSTSSSPSVVANLPPIRVHADDGGSGGGGVRAQDQKLVGIEEQFAQLGVGGVAQMQDEGFVVLSSPPAVAVNVSAAAAVAGVPISSSAAVAGEYHSRVVSDDERSDQGVPVGHRKSPPIYQPQAQALPPQFQQKSTGIADLPSPDSVSSDTSLSNAMSHPKPVIYQDQVQIQSATSPVPGTSVDLKLNVSDPHGRIQLQHLVPEPGYVLQQQFDQQQQFGQLLHQQQQQQQQFGQLLHQQQQQQQQQQQAQAQQQPQFIPGTHFIQHTPAGPVPITAYYPVYPSQQHPIPQHHHQPDQPYPVYFVPARQTQAYNLSVQHPNVGESTATIPSSQPQNPPNPAAMVPPSAAYNPMGNTPMPKSEMTAGTYSTATAGTPQLVQVPASQHQQQYVAYSQIHHPSQSMAPNSAAPANYAYVDPAHTQLFYTQHLAPAIPSQYHNMTAAAVVVPEVSAQLPSDIRKQQVRTSQPL